MTSAFALLLALTWIVSDAAVRRSSPDVVAAGRSFFSCLGICLLATRNSGALRRSLNLLRARPASLALSGLLGVALYAFSSLQAISLLGVSIPNLLLATTPCLSMGIGALLFRLRSPRIAVLGVLFATVGAVVYVLGSFTVSGPGSQPGAGWGVAAAVVAVVAIAVYGQHYARLSKGHDPLDLLPGIFGLGTLMLLLLLAVTGRLVAIVDIDPATLGLLVLLGVVIYVPVYVIQHLLIHRQGAVYMASISLVVPFLVRALDMLFFDAPPPSLAEAIGMLICLGGVLLVVRHPSQQRPQESDDH
ncbi:hypothetical protein GCM10009841_02020 [Microlunatus panaciterrae]|uniref:Drug/metabolite transporter (DMT)-like permease n=2 Tax=Microlunatus panaciterrae TaxID=400768 RepID=A0ABS2RKN6_9ACTN|nr:DMT family transporter [Microlunatus panaciterrae]MBM7799283.1 drug/metabolite transporter (DMT)-like permease [Microlunatus panaciterrae]